MSPTRPDLAPPVFIVSTGRCGSTLLSKLVKLHPQLLSVSEFWTCLAFSAFRGGEVTGAEVHRRLNEPPPLGRSMMVAGMKPSELLYEFGPEARYGPGDIPPILIATLPHLSDEHEALWDELGSELRERSRAPLQDHYRFIFDWLCTRFERKVWLERSGASLLLVPAMAERFPDARFVHLYRDGRAVALSMRKHEYFQVRASGTDLLDRLGLDTNRPFNVAGTSPWMPWIEKLGLPRLLDPDKIRSREVSLATFGRFWSRMIEGGLRSLDALPTERVLTMRYEDLVERPREELRRFIRFVGTDFEDETWLERAAAQPRARPAPWLQLESEVLEPLTQACQPGLELLGYREEAS